MTAPRRHSLTAFLGLAMMVGPGVCDAGEAAPLGLPSPTLIAKPTDGAKERRARVQPAVPAGATEIAFVETAPQPELTDAERQRGYLLFARPAVEPVYPNTRPRADERLAALLAFATPGQFEPVNLVLYPVRPLVNLRVRASALTCPAGEISADRIDVRLGTYGNVGYPSYTTVKTYRRTPELLERVTVHSSPAAECQRYWLTIHVPEDAKPGLYEGMVSVWDDGFDRALSIPIALRVLGFRLQKDPAKHYSTYFYVRNPSFYQGRSEAFIRRAADNDYHAMVDFGLDMIPTLNVGCDNGREIVLRHAEEIPRMLAAGLQGSAPVTADGVIERLYRDTTPGGKHGDHWRISPPPPPEFYDRLTELFRAFEEKRKANGWPEFVYCPMDEVDPSCRDFAVKVYAAIKVAGVRTYATKDPAAPDAAAYAPYLDIWCSQPYSVPFERIAAQQRHEYWCYPNHNACEIKDRLTMCKGGRMTYGFGFWRSGYTTLIPWNWNWTCAPDPFDYLGGKYSGCGQRMDDEDEVIPAVYWSCFRDGYNDARYIYTLQQAITERRNSAEPGCLAAVRNAQRVLQETWDSIRVQPKYLAAGMWPSEEFNAIRWRLAAQTQSLLKYPATSKATAPSVLVDTTAGPPAHALPLSKWEFVPGKIETFDLGGGFGAWRNGTAEGKIEITEDAQHDLAARVRWAEDARRDRAVGLRWTVAVDWEHDGGEGGKYPIGWPRISRSFKSGELDLSRYESLVFWLRLDSSCSQAEIRRTPIGLVIRSHKLQRPLYEKTLDLGQTQRTWIPLRLSVPEMIEAAGGGAEPWKSISLVQLFVSESEYPHGTRLVFDLGEALCQRLREPTLVGLEAPHVVLLPRSAMSFTFEVAGASALSRGSHAIVAALETADGTTCAAARQDAAGARRMTIALSAIPPGPYILRATIRDAQGRQCSQWSHPLVAEAGPLSE